MSDNHLVAVILVPSHPYKDKERPADEQALVDDFHEAILVAAVNAKCPVKKEHIYISIHSGHQPSKTEQHVRVEWRIYTNLPSLSLAQVNELRKNIRKKMREEIQALVIKKHDFPETRIPLPGDIFPLEKLTEDI